MSLEKRIDYYIIDDKNYEIIEPIKKGAYGSIFLVEEFGTNNKYAAKQMLNFNSFENFQYFIREIDIFMRVKNICVIGFKGFSFRLGDVSYPAIFLEYAENGSIQSKLDEARLNKIDPNWTPTKRMISLVGIAYGMMQLHKENIIHRDLKPGNVLLDKNYHPKITDFGLSKFENKNLEQSITLGTPLYMAPEMSEDSTFTNSVDVFAYGIMAYEIITLKPPYKLRRNENQFSVINKVIEGARPEIEDGDMSPELKGLLERCWSKIPTERLTFREITTLLFKEEYSMPDIDEGEYLDYIKNLGKDYESSNTTNEASLLIKEANNGNLDQIKIVADNFYEGKDGFPHDEAKALYYYRFYSIISGKQNDNDNESENVGLQSNLNVSEPVVNSGKLTEKQITSRKQKAKTMIFSSKLDLGLNLNKIDFIQLTQRALQLKITNYNIFVYGNKSVRSPIVSILTDNQMVTHKEIAFNFMVHRIYSCSVSLTEAKNVGFVTEDELTTFIKEKATKAPKEERLKHCFYCLNGDEDSIFSDNDERIIKYMAKYILVTIIILQCTNSRFRDQVLKHTSGGYFLEDAMSNPKNVKKGPCIISISSDDTSFIIQKLQNYINFLPSILT